MNAARWVLVGVLAGGSVLFVIGCVLGTTIARRSADRDWRALFVELGEDHGRELAEWRALVDELEAELDNDRDQLAKADATIAQLNQNIGVVWDAGVMAGQTFQADRQENDL